VPEVAEVAEVAEEWAAVWVALELRGRALVPTPLRRA
jgi:hypothetical protein